MEFYSAIFNILSGRYSAFQFPTGWNSTRVKNLRQLIATVSIPNGMEFYYDEGSRIAVLKRFQFPTGWNSTRKIAIITPNLLVSIPNGMEFYGEVWDKSQNKCSFNSQRDGILHGKGDGSTTGDEFQFPTGWNSTNSSFLKELLSLLFQFPTGWNSTKAVAKKIRNIFVSIPNGMEFYFKTPASVSAPDGFNSQRDGILPSRFQA